MKYGIRFTPIGTANAQQSLHYQSFETREDAERRVKDYFIPAEKPRIVKFVPKKKNAEEIVQDLALIDAVAKAACDAFSKSRGWAADKYQTTEAKNAWCAAVLAGMVVAAKGTTK